MTDKQPNALLGRLTSLITFVIATVICCLYFFTGNLDYGFYGYFFFLVALPVNIIILVVLLVKSSKSEQLRKTYQGIGWMLLNIPVAVFYFGVGIYFTGVMRITIQNSTGKDIKNIQILGCENERLEILRDGESETVWIDINGDCSISMSYEDILGFTQNEILVGYVTNGMGQKFTYRVGSNETGW